MAMVGTISRRKVLGGALLGGLGLAAAACAPAGWPIGESGGGAPGHPGSLPDPSKPAGTDLLPQVDHIVVLMMENRSFDCILGMLGRGDGYTIGKDGLPTNSNPDGSGQDVRAYHAPTECRSYSQPTNSWNATHLAWDHGKMNGFITNGSGDPAMAYWDGSDIPFTWSMAKTFPICDQYHCSLLGPTFPNRRYLISGTSLGMASDVPELSDIVKTFGARPPHGTIFDSLNDHKIGWKNYFSLVPLTLSLYPYLLTEPANFGKIVPIGEFFSDAAKGTLPPFSLVEPNYLLNSEGEGQDIQFGDAFLAKVVNAILDSPAWPRTLFVWTYDEAGGYYDHVPPPKAPEPDNVQPEITVPPDQPGTFGRYGIRVPAGVVSPYAKKNYVSSKVADHTSVLRLVETKWNLPALTYRDANATNLLDCVDFSSAPAFLEPPKLAAPANPLSSASCIVTGSGSPPPGAVSAAQALAHKS